MKHNARFVFGPDSFPVVATDFSYGWTMTTSAKSQARHAQVIYPKRVEQNSLSLSLVFPSVEEYLAFGNFIRMCQVGLTSFSDPYDLFFISDSIGSNGVKYSVAIGKCVMQAKVNDVAPTATLTLTIVRDMLDARIIEYGSVERQKNAATITGQDFDTTVRDIADVGNLAAADMSFWRTAVDKSRSSYARIFG